MANELIIKKADNNCLTISEVSHIETQYVVRIRNIAGVMTDYGTYTNMQEANAALKEALELRIDELQHELESFKLVMESLK